jgi:hypothetical protein
MDDSNVDKMLEKSVKKSTLDKYGRAWDKWSIFATYHGVDVVPPDMRAFEIFVANTAELSGFAGVASMSAAAITHFGALEGVQSPFTTPRFGKILRGIRNKYGKPVKPKKPFSRLHITTFMDWARGGLLLDGRAALPMALCYQQLLRGAEAFDLNGSNVDRRGDYFWVKVKTSKNHPEGFLFKVPVDANRPHDFGTILADFVVKMGIKLGDPKSYFACTVMSVKGVLKSVSSVQVSTAMMQSNCKKLITATGLDARDYATHSCKRGGALAALEARLSDVQVQDLDRWSSSVMVARYTEGNPDVREVLA